MRACCSRSAGQATKVTVLPDGIRVGGTPPRWRGATRSGGRFVDRCGWRGRGRHRPPRAGGRRSSSREGSQSHVRRADACPRCVALGLARALTDPVLAPPLRADKILNLLPLAEALVVYSRPVSAGGDHAAEAGDMLSPPADVGPLRLRRRYAGRRRRAERASGAPEDHEAE
jgi:hypothetical protein